MAVAGKRFTFLSGEHEECQSCPLTKLCYNLTPGTKYEVETVRTLTHPCNLHDDDRVQVVTVKPVGFRSTVEKKRLRGTAVTWEPIDCGYAECKNWALCHPTGMPVGKQFALDGPGKDLACPMNYDLQVVQFKA